MRPGLPRLKRRTRSVSRSELPRAPHLLCLWTLPELPRGDGRASRAPGAHSRKDLPKPGLAALQKQLQHEAVLHNRE